ncbi:MAG: hypothetical protein KDF58_09715 [Alphaproteobacteria bacterium]|nr:hypothetical protein [Alphaproteobacteria bacterium]HPF46643.1 hypothetical protein [Emcibacteraceae bacterium]
MQLKQKIFTALLILLVLTGQAMAAKGANSCDMNMHKMDHKIMAMSSGKMDCCDDDPICAMDCSLAISCILPEFSLTGFEYVSTQQIDIPVISISSQPLTSLFRPPISA